MGSGVVWQHSVQQDWKAECWDVGPLYAQKELNPYELTIEPWFSVSGSWKAELGNPACSDPFLGGELEPESCRCHHVLVSIYEYAAHLLLSAVLVAGHGHLG